MLWCGSLLQDCAESSDWSRCYCRELLAILWEAETDNKIKVLSIGIGKCKRQ